MYGPGLYITALWTATLCFAGVGGFFLYLVLNFRAVLDPGNVFGVTSCFLMAVICAAFALVAMRKAALANRRAREQQDYMKVEEGYDVDSDVRTSMYDPFGELKPIHKRCLDIITAVADPQTGLSIKTRKIGTREVLPAFVGFRFIDWAIRTEQCKTRQEAAQLGRDLIRKRYLLRSDGKTSATHKSRRGRELADFVDDAVFYYFAVRERPKLFTGLPEEVLDRLLYGHIPEKAGTPNLVLLPIGVFAVPLATTGLSLAWLGMGQLFSVPALVYLGLAISGLAIILFVSLLVAYAVKTFRHWAAVKDELNHPFKLNLFGVIPLTILNLASIAVAVDLVLCQVVFYIGAVLQLFVTLGVTARWVRIARRLDDINPSYFIPIVGLAAIPIAAVPAGVGAIGFLILGACVGYWLLMFALLFLRVFFVGALPRTSLPMLFMAVAPPSMITTAYISLNPIMDIGAQLLFGIAFFNVALFTVIRLSTPRLPFMLTHWAYVFPLCSFAVASQRYASIIRGTTMAAASVSTLLVSIAITAASLFWLWAALNTAVLGFGRKLIGREAMLLSEETAAKVRSGKIKGSSADRRPGTLDRATGDRGTMDRGTFDRGTTGL